MTGSIAGTVTDQEARAITDAHIDATQQAPAAVFTQNSHTDGVFTIRSTGCFVITALGKCQLRLFTKMFNVLDRRASELASVLPAELRSASVSDLISDCCSVHGFGKEQPPCFLESKLLLILEGAHIGKSAEMFEQTGGAHAGFVCEGAQ